MMQGTRRTPRGRKCAQHWMFLHKPLWWSIMLYSACWPTSNPWGCHLVLDASYLHHFCTRKKLDWWFPMLCEYNSRAVFMEQHCSIELMIRCDCTSHHVSYANADTSMFLIRKQVYNSQSGILSGFVWYVLFCSTVIYTRSLLYWVICDAPTSCFICEVFSWKIVCWYLENIVSKSLLRDIQIHTSFSLLCSTCGYLSSISTRC